MGGSTPPMPEPPEPPKVVRAPTEQDPSVLNASKRTRKQALSRSGRRSTLLTRNTQNKTTNPIASSGSNLGA